MTAPYLNPFSAPLVDTSTVPGSPDHVDGRAIIGYDSIFRRTDAVVVADSIEGFPPENAFDDLTYDYWATEEGTDDKILTVTFDEAVSADYLGVASHDLFSQDAVIDFRRFNPDTSEWESVLLNDGYVPTSDAPFMLTFDRKTSTQWRFVVMGSSSAKIGIIFAGMALPLQRFVRVGHVPGPFNDDLVYVNNESEGGEFIGRSLVRRASVAELVLSYLTPAWVRAKWKPFQIHARTKPWFFQWDSWQHQDEVIFGYADSEPKPSLMNPLYESVSIKMRGKA